MDIPTANSSTIDRTGAKLALLAQCTGGKAVTTKIPIVSTKQAQTTQNTNKRVKITCCKLEIPMNASLTFEVLLYLNSYYFGLFAVCEIGINVVKAINLSSENSAEDFGILLAVCALELFRVVLARRGNLTEKSKLWKSMF